jgi:hypothetical protein
MLTSGKVNKYPKTRHFFSSKTPLNSLKIARKSMLKMLTTFVDNPQIIPILKKLIPTYPVDKTKSLISFCLAKRYAM